MKKTISMLIFLGLSIQLLAQSNTRVVEGVKLSGGRSIASEEELKQNIFFNQLNAGLSYLNNGDSRSGAFEIGLQTIHYMWVLGKKKTNVKVENGQADEVKAIRTNYYFIDFYLLNRASMNTDSIKTIASDFMMSLQPSPLTLRFDLPIRLSKNDVISTKNINPVVILKFGTDVRLTPFSKETNIEIGTSGHGFATLTFNFAGYRVDDANNSIADKGYFYFEPSYLVSYGNSELMKSLLVDYSKKKVFQSLDVRLGYHSNISTVNDFGLIISYTWVKIIGSNIRASVMISH